MITLLTDEQVSCSNDITYEDFTMIESPIEDEDDFIPSRCPLMLLTPTE